VIVLVRHGETDANRAGLLLGRANPTLNERGREQAAAVAAALRRDPVSLILTSPLDRARETAAAIGGATGVEVEVEPSLTEMDYGDWDERRLTDLPPAVAAQWRADPAFAPPGGESLAELRGRVGPCTLALLERAADGTVIVVSHVSPIKTMILVALDLGDLFAWRLRLDVASISRVGPGPSGPVLISFNDTGHLR
jgi:broad specificity phosphatase PhoE